jgi:hypothetical protein
MEPPSSHAATPYGSTARTEATAARVR